MKKLMKNEKTKLYLNLVSFEKKNLSSIRLTNDCGEKADTS